MALDVAKIDEKELPTTGTPENKPELKFASRLHFRPADGNYNVLTREDRNLTDEDVTERGFRGAGDKVSFSFARLLDELPADLYAPSEDMSSERKEIVASLSQRKPTFVALDSARVDSEFSTAAAKFEGGQLGVILLPETNSLMNQFSAIRFADGRIARLTHGGTRENQEKFVAQLNLLSPRVEAREINREQSAYAVEFMQGAERPRTISRQEADDWFNRVRLSGLIFGFDVSAKDESLDNLVRKEGKLFWVDGNILRARPAKTPEEVEAFIKEQEDILEKFIKE